MNSDDKTMAIFYCAILAAFAVVVVAGFTYRTVVDYARATHPVCVKCGGKP